jgi:cell division transport system permease protein
MKRPIVFSLVHEQSVFMTAVMGLMTFLTVLALGLALAIGGGVVRWNSQWNSYASVQVSGEKNAGAVKKIFAENKDKIESNREVSAGEMLKLMRPWVDGGRDTLEKYLPIMFELKFKSNSDMAPVADAVKKYGRFISHSDALRPSVSAGWKMVAILTVILALIIGTIGFCISFIARNTAVLHRRELEILNQVGASDSFVARQMQIIVARICFVACSVGFLAAVPVLLGVIAVAHSARVGLMAMLNIGGIGWGVLIAVPVVIIVFAILIARKTTLKILDKQQ